MPAFSLACVYLRSSVTAGECLRCPRPTGEQGRRVLYNGCRSVHLLGVSYPSDVVSLRGNGISMALYVSPNQELCELKRRGCVTQVPHCRQVENVFAAWRKHFLPVAIMRLRSSLPAGAEIACDCTDPLP
jgi:hypothetical protein